MDLKDLFTLIERFEHGGLSELTWKKDGEEISLKKGGPVRPTAAPSAEAPGSQPAAASPAGEFIRAPIVGTFYRSPTPDAPPFVEPGSAVRKGQTLCILEAMKLMNEFQAESDLVIVSVLVENGAMVEFGTPLFEVRRP